MAVIAGCRQQETGLAKIEADELNSGRKIDTLFMGLRLGMTRKDFFDRCLELNQAHLFTMGAGGNFVQYGIDSAMKAPATMKFYPAFEDDHIRSMDAYFYYNAWAPWNQELAIDTLQQDVMRLLTKWYGGRSFVQSPAKNALGQYSYMKIDGNRRMLVSIHNEYQVKVYFENFSDSQKAQ